MLKLLAQALDLVFVKAVLKVSGFTNRSLLRFFVWRTAEWNSCECLASLRHVRRRDVHFMSLAVVIACLVSFVLGELGEFLLEFSFLSLIFDHDDLTPRTSSD